MRVLSSVRKTAQRSEQDLQTCTLGGLWLRRHMRWEPIAEHKLMAPTDAHTHLTSMVPSTLKCATASGSTNSLQSGDRT